MEIKYFNSRKLRLTTNKLIKAEEGEKELWNITLNGELKYSKGNKIPVIINSEDLDYKTFYYCDRIFKVDSKTIEISEFNITDTTIFTLPLLGLTKEELLWDKVFINAYISAHDFDGNVGEVCHLIYRYMPFSFYSKLIEYLKKKSNFNSYKKDYIDKRFDRISFIIPKIYLKDVYLILEGNLSKISDATKQLICNFHNINNHNKIYEMLNTNVALRDRLIVDYGEELPEDIKRKEFNINNETWKIDIK
jgi:hypothetical protein